jgi:D-alanyl-D-alanine carboxypeptidase
MRRALALALCAGFLPVSGVAAAATQPTKVARRIVASGMPGAVVLVKDRAGTRTGAAGFADLGRRSAMRANTSFRIGSVTKSFVAALVLQLAQRGVLRLDDPVERWLPGRVPNGGAITLRQLLNHTSGLYDYSADPLLADAMYRRPVPWLPLSLVAVGTSHPPLFAPGTGWGYSNTNYVLLGLVVQAAAQTSVRGQLARRILQPLHLRRTSLPQTPALTPPFARGYLLPGAVGARADVPRTDVTGIGATWAWTAGGAASTASEVARFYNALLRGRIVRPLLLGEMKRPVTIDGNGNGYGLGLSLSRVGCGLSWGHNGSVPGYTSYVMNTPTADRQVVVLVNGTPGGVEQRAAVDNAVVEAFCSS